MYYHLYRKYKQRYLELKSQLEDQSGGYLESEGFQEFYTGRLEFLRREFDLFFRIYNNTFIRDARAGIFQVKSESLRDVSRQYIFRFYGGLHRVPKVLFRYGVDPWVEVVRQPDGGFKTIVDRDVKDIGPQLYLDKAADLVKKTFSHDVRYSLISDSMTVVIPYDSRDFSDEQVLKKLVFRYPINVAGERNGDDKFMERYLGYDKNEVEVRLNLGTRGESEYSGKSYAIGGFSYTDQRKDNLIGVVHSWAPNFENPSTYDCRHLLVNGRIDRDRYQERIRRMLLSIYRCALEVGRKIIRQQGLLDTQITVRLVEIGQDAYLSEVKSFEDKQFCSDTYFNLARDLSKGFPQLDVCYLVYTPLGWATDSHRFVRPGIEKRLKEVPVKLVENDFDGDEDRGLPLATRERDTSIGDPSDDDEFYQRNKLVKNGKPYFERDYLEDISRTIPSTGAKTRDNFFIYLGNNAANVIANKRPSEKVLILTNAWDDLSLIGNGGAADCTVDGYIVTGPSSYCKRVGMYKAKGAALVNTSYLHNPVFTPSVLDPSHWIRLEA
jgi:hypothetical protein